MLPGPVIRQAIHAEGATFVRIIFTNITDGLARDHGASQPRPGRAQGLDAFARVSNKPLMERLIDEFREQLIGGGLRPPHPLQSAQCGRQCAAAGSDKAETCAGRDAA